MKKTGKAASAAAKKTTAFSSVLLPFGRKWHLPLIIITALAAYINTLGHSFALDDVAVISQNSIVKQGIKGIPHLLRTFYWQGYWNSNAGLYRPLSLITFAAEWQLSPNNPAIHHFFNVLYYVLICCLAYRLLCRWFAELDPGIVLLVVLLFAVHPAHTEVVANIKSRDELLALLFFLLSALAFRPGNTKAILLSAFYFFISLFAKEGAVMLLPVLLLYIHLSQRQTLPQTLKMFLPFFFLSALWLLIHQLVIRSGPAVITYTYNDNALVAAHSPAEQKATALSIVARYFIKLLFPYELSYDYSFNQVPIVGLFSAGALGGLAMLAAVAYFFFRWYKKDTFIAVAIAFIVFPLLLTCNLLFNIGATAADRFLFVSSLGSSMLLVYMPCIYIREISRKRVVVLYGAIALSVIFMGMTVKRNKAWKDDFTLFQSDVKVAANSARTHYNYGTALLGRSKVPGDGQMLEAKAELEKALAIDPLYFDALLNLGSLNTRLKSYPEAIALYRRAERITGRNAELAGNMGEAFYRNNEPDTAIVYMELAHRLGNENVESYNIEATSLFMLKKYEESCRIFEQGLAKDSIHADVYLNYGNALAVSNRTSEAIRAFERSYSLDNTNPQPLYYLAITYNKLGDTLNAGRYYAQYKNMGGK